MNEPFCEYVLLFFLYSFAGWLWESIVCSLYDHGRLINRGFLNGPYCPIYGWGALCGILLLRSIDSPVFLFLCAGVSTCTLEYLTSYAMEKLFHARWWDYSDKPFNLNGRIYLNGFLAFGMATVLLIKWINPFMVSVIGQVSPQGLAIPTQILILVYLGDNIVTFSEFIPLAGKMRKTQDSF